MNNEQIRKLCLALLRANSETEVVTILQEAGYWDNPKSWRLYGDTDGNFATIGNQQSRPEAALVEKIVNCVDARLMNECLRRGIDPTSRTAPPSIRQAVSSFFEGRESIGDLGGTVQSWSQSRQREQAQYITLSATGARQSPCLVIADCGEGQTPGRMPETFLSIAAASGKRSNKLRIPFVQGKFNMGGTGALKFCGHHKLQLIISRRNPEIVKAMKDDDPAADRWGFTVVRRDRPHQGAGEVRNSVFRYLAPIGAESTPEHGEVLSFQAAELNLMPDGNDAYARPISYGSCIKLYEYDMKGFKSNIILGRDCLKTRLELLLPEPALPIRLHECRDFRGHAGSFSTSMLGLLGRLAADRADNIEEGYPSSATLKIHGQEMIATIYAFKAETAESYRTNEGIVFSVNGQTHGTIPKTFYSRSSVKMGRLAKSLLVVVDCSRLSVDAREDLFMNSRDRLSSGELRKAVEDALEDLIGKHPGLRELQNRRKAEEIAERLKDSKPLEDVLESILKNSPSLEKLFLLGQRLSRPHRAGAPGSRPGGGEGPDEGDGEFVGRPHPTYFRFHRKRDGETLNRDAELGRRCRIKFETDVANDYLARDANRGRYNVEVASGALEGTELDNTLTLHNGIGNWSISIPDEEVDEGDELTLLCTVRDDVIPDPFVNVARLGIVRQSTPNGGNGGRTGRRGTGQRGGGGSGGGGTGGTQGQDGPPEPAGLQMPEIIEVHESEWPQHEFDENSGCTIIEDASSDTNGDQSVYTFYVNVDNIFLRTDMKSGSDDAAVKKAKFVFGNVLVGLALIHEQKRHPKSENANGDTEEQTIQAVVSRTTRALAPFLVPMIDYLGALTADEVAGLAQTGDDE